MSAGETVVQCRLCGILFCNVNGRYSDACDGMSAPHGAPTDGVLTLSAASHSITGADERAFVFASCAAKQAQMATGM